MPKACWLALAVTCSVVGLAWLALAMEVHWAAAKGVARLTPRKVLALRASSGLALLASLAACLHADHASMAALVWIMSLALAAPSVALVLAWRPRLLGRIVP